MALWAFVGRRLLLLLPILAGASLLTFLLVHFTPTSPVELMLGPNATPEQVTRLYRDLGLDRPFVTQYARFVVRAAHGDFGLSLKTGRPVWEDISERMAATVELATAAFVIVVGLGLVVGIVSALRPGGLLDHATRVLAMLGVATPIFWLGLLLQLLFFSAWHLLPLNGRGDIYILLDHPPARITGLLTVDALLSGNWIVLRTAAVHMVLPAATLGYRSLALVARMVRSSLLEVLQQDYIRTAAAFGHSRRRVVSRYALPNALLPVLTVLGFEFGKLLGGTFLVESVFDWPGMGLYALEAIANADFPAILGVSMVLTAVYIVISLAVDVGYAWLDPRIRYD